MARAGGTGAYARRLALGLGQRLVVNPVDAQGAFFHHPGGMIIFARAIGTRPTAQLAADAFVFVDQHDAVRGAFVRGPGGTHGDARRVGAMQARAGKIDRAGALGLRPLDLVAVHPVEPDAVGLAPLGVEIAQRADHAAAVPFLTRHRAGMTADAGIEVDHQTELLGRRRGGQAGHWSGALAISRRTRRSYHAAWPVTGSALAKRVPSASGGSCSEIA